MDFIEAIVLGIIQGLTEFLPVSSSGHLELAKAILGDTSVPEESLTFTVVLHFATALSTIVIFRKEIIEMFGGQHADDFLNWICPDDIESTNKSESLVGVIELLRDAVSSKL